MNSQVLKSREGKAVAISDTDMPLRIATKLDISDILLDAASWSNPIVEAADEASQLAESIEDFSNKIP